MPDSDIQKRWIASIAVSLAMALVATIGTSSWGDRVSAGTTVVGPQSETTELVASDPALSDQFGEAVDIDGDTAVVGAASDDDGASDSGSAYVYVFSSGTWSQQQKLTAPDPDDDAYFGRAVAISGDTLVVGAYADESGAGTDEIGSAYVYVRSGTTWTLQQKLTPSGGADTDFFGWSVDIDGDSIIVGAIFDDTTGSAFVFVRSGTTWTEQQKITAGDAAASDEFGRSVSMDGNTVVIGASEDDDTAGGSGSAYVFTRSGTAWTLEQKLTASDPALSDRFGTSVAVSGDTIIASATWDDDNSVTDSGSVYVFTRSGTTWSQQTKLTASDAGTTDLLGEKVSLSGDVAIATSRLHDSEGSNAGAAYIFSRSGTTWTQHPKLIASDASVDDWFGQSAAIDNNVAIVGARQGDSGVTDSGSAYVFGGAPGAPTGVAGTAGNAKATVSWTNSSSGSSTITSYTVTASPGGATANTSGTSVDVTGLSNGTAYTFTVTATNALGTSLASAASSAVTPVAPVTATGEVLTDLLTATSLSLSTNQVVGISVSPRNELGAENLSMPNVVYTWNAGSCGTLDSTTSRTPIFTASGNSCSGTITVHASQGGNPQVPTSDRSISVAVNAPPPAAAPTAVPTDPAVIPTITPAGLSSDDVAVILPSSGGTFNVPQAAGVDTPPISIEIPGGALDSGTAAAVTINVVSVGSVPAPPPAATEGATSGTFRFGSTIIEVQWYDDTGSELDTFKLNRPAEICVPFAPGDIAGATGGPDGMAVWRYNGTEWIQLNSTVNISDGTVCARTLNFSFFALGLAVAVSDADEATLPATGDYSPGTSTLILILLAGLALLASGVVALRRTRGIRTVH